MNEERKKCQRAINFIKSNRREECFECSMYYIRVLGDYFLAFQGDMYIKACKGECWIDKWWEQ